MVDTSQVQHQEKTATNWNSSTKWRDGTLVFDALFDATDF